MESGRGRARRGALAVPLLLVLSACAVPRGETATPSHTTSPSTSTTLPAVVVASFALPDITQRSVEAGDLTAVLASLGATEDADRSNETLVTSAPDRNDESEDIIEFARETGAAGILQSESATDHLWIDVLGDPDRAHGYLLDFAGDISKGFGGTHAPNVLAESVAAFPVQAGEEAIGMVAALESGATETIIISRLGRLVVFASRVEQGTADERVAVQYLVDSAIEAVVSHLTEDRAAARPAAPSYRFETSMTITDTAADTSTSTTSGTVTQTTLSCRATTAGRATEVIGVDGRYWWAGDEGDLVSVSAANTQFAAVLARCPQWPLSFSAAAVTGLVESDQPMRHHINGVDALGYEAGAKALFAALGRDVPAAVEVENFTMWVAEGTPWLVEVAIVATGPADQLQVLTGEDHGSETIRLVFRQRIFDLGSAAPATAPSP